MSTPFLTTLTILETSLSKAAPDQETLVQGFYGLRRNWPEDPTPDNVRRTFAVCHKALGLTGKGRLSYAIMEVIKRLVVDPVGRHRNHVRRSFDHHTAFGEEMPGGRFDGPIPVAHLPLTVAEARALLQPLLTSFEAEIETQPLQASNLAWDVLSHPVAPFDRVFTDWMKDLEARGLGAGYGYSVLSRSMAFHALAERGRQRVSRKGVDKIFLPVLDDPNPMLAAAAARFLGCIHVEPEDFYHNGTPWALADLLMHIAERPPTTRRAVAGGFLDGFADCDEPFQLLREDARLEGFDLDGWVISVLGGTSEEVLIPSAQAFWFYVHEGFAVNAAFVTRLIDEGHDWIAMMCATELRAKVDGMEAVLMRLSESRDKEAAAGAVRHLAQVYRAVQ